MNDNLNFKAFDEGGMDEFLRKTVEGHRVEPNPGLWKGISRTLLWRELLRFNFSNLSVKSRVAGVAGLIILAAALYFIIPTTSSTTPVAVSTPAPTGSVNSTARPVVINASTPVANVTRPAGNIVPGSAAVNSTPHAAQKTATAPEPARQPQMYANTQPGLPPILRKVTAVLFLIFQPPKILPQPLPAGSRSRPTARVCQGLCLMRQNSCRSTRKQIPSSPYILFTARPVT